MLYCPLTVRLTLEILPVTFPVRLPLTLPFTFPVRVPDKVVKFPAVAPTVPALTVVAVRVFTLLILLLHISRFPLRATEPAVRVPISATPTRAVPVLTRRVEMLSKSEMPTLRVPVEVKMEEKEFVRISLDEIALVLSVKEDRPSIYATGAVRLVNVPIGLMGA